MLLKCRTQYASKYGKLSSDHKTRKGFHSNPKEEKCQRMFRLLHNCTHFTCQQGNAQNLLSQTSTVGKPRTSRYTKAEEPEIKLPVSVESQKKQGNSRKVSNSVSLATLKPLTVQITTNCEKNFKDMGIPDNLTCLLRNLYAGQEATARTGHGTMDWFKIRKGVCQYCILSPYLFNFFAECIM